MSVQLIDESISERETFDAEVIPLPPTDLPYDDGEPLESNRHRIAMNILIDSLHQAYQGRDDYFTSGNMFIYYSSEQVKNQDFRGPDFFVVFNVDGTQERRSWIVWEEKGRYPDVIVELMSASTARIDVKEKKVLYEQTFRTQDYFVYDPFNAESLLGWHLGDKGRYEAITPDQRGWLWCENLGLWLGTWEGVLVKERATWLRFYDAQGDLILLPHEVAEQERFAKEQERERAERERERADQAEWAVQQLRQRLQQLGFDPESLG